MEKHKFCKFSFVFIWRKCLYYCNFRDCNVWNHCQPNYMCLLQEQGLLKCYDHVMIRSPKQIIVSCRTGYGFVGSSQSSACFMFRLSCSSVQPFLITFIVSPNVLLQINFTQDKKRVPGNVRSEIVPKSKVIIKFLRRSPLRKKQKRTKYQNSRHQSREFKEGILECEVILPKYVNNNNNNNNTLQVVPLLVTTYFVTPRGHGDDIR